MKARQYIEAEIRELGDEKVKLRARHGQITSEIQALIQERSANITRSTAIDADLTALRRALATLQEHVPEPVTESVAPEVIDVPAPKPVEASPKPRTLPPGTPHRRSHPDPMKAAKKAAKAKATPEPVTQRAADPLHVVPRKQAGGKVCPHTERALTYDGNIELRPRDLSPTVRQRADLLLEVLRENDGAISQYAMAEMMTDLMECKRQTAQAIVSQCVRLMAHNQEIIWTGQKVPSRPNGRVDSLMWKIVTTPAERASAGLPVTDDNFAGRTTQMYTNTRARVQIESSGFEQGKRA